MSTTELPTDPDSPVETPRPPAEEAVPADNAGGDVAEDVAANAVADAAVSTPRSRRASLVIAVVLGVLLLGALAIGGWLYLLLGEAHGQIRDQHEQLNERDQQLEEQKEIIDQKETFSAAMVRLQDTMQGVDGLPFATLAENDRFQELATRGWTHRWHVNAVKTDTKAAEEITAKLDEVVMAAQAEAATNSTGTAWEAALDQLGRGYVSMVMDPDATFCDDQAMACVRSDDPFVVHVVAPSDAEPHNSDWIRTGAAYHEFAHVLQYTNPVQTDATLPVFGGDVERMADCYALTMLDGWTLDHRTWVNAYEYWEVSVGYGYTCNDSERQAIRDWNAQLGPTPTA